MPKANIVKRMGTTVFNSILRFLSISIQDKGITKGQKIVVIKNMRKDKNLSSGVEVGCSQENLIQLLKKYADISR